MTHQALNLTGISRSKEYSPNHEEDDYAILSLVADELRNRNYEVTVYSEQELTRQNIYGKVIFNMSRKDSSIQLLKEMELTGTTVINSAFGIENCYKKNLTNLFNSHGIPCPRTIVVSTRKEFPSVPFPCWIKKANSHTLVKNDVVYVECREEGEKVFEEFRNRNLAEAVISEHAAGDLIKFYGVYHTDFFYTFYPTEQSYSKFGLEHINGKIRGFHFDKRLLKACCNQAANILNVPVYGGDCIITSDGEIKIIDFNDWPSFALCKELAAAHIADCIQGAWMQRIADAE